MDNVSPVSFEQELALVADLLWWLRQVREHLAQV